MNKNPINDGLSRDLPTEFIKYLNFDDYRNNYYDSSDDENNKEIETETDIKLDLNESVVNLTTLTQLIEIAKLPYNRFQPCNRDDLSALKKIIKPLEELNCLIGMDDLKSQIIDQVVFYCQGLHKVENSQDEGIFMHTVIQGPPGCGKTTVAKIISKIYLKLGVLKSDKIVIPQRKDLIGEHLGQTAVKTYQSLESALGGVVFIDEAYALGNESNNLDDIYSKECIDTINQFLSEHKHEIVVIIAGYKDQLKKCFFSVNQGLQRRFPWVYDIENYKPLELQKIFVKQTQDRGWKFDNNNCDAVVPVEILIHNKEFFEYGGGDTETLLTKCQLAHGRNTFGLDPEKKKKLTKKDIINGLARHVKNKDPKDPIPDLYT